MAYDFEWEKTFKHEDEAGCGRKPGTVWSVTVKARGNIDRNYGADADGRRGTKMYFVEEYVYESWMKDGEEVLPEIIPADVKQDLLSQIIECRDWRDE